MRDEAVKLNKVPTVTPSSTSKEATPASSSNLTTVPAKMIKSASSSASFFAQMKTFCPSRSSSSAGPNAIAPVDSAIDIGEEVAAEIKKFRALPGKISFHNIHILNVGISYTYILHLVSNRY